MNPLAVLSVSVVPPAEEVTNKRPISSTACAGQGTVRLLVVVATGEPFARKITAILVTRPYRQNMPSLRRSSIHGANKGRRVNINGWNIGKI